MIGVDPDSPSGSNELQNTSFRGSFDYEDTTFNRQTRALFTGARLTNISDETLTPPALVAMDRFMPPSVTLANADQFHDDGRPLVSFADELGLSGLAAGATSSPADFEFANPDRQRFDFETSLLSAGNTAPLFTSAPPVVATVGVSYGYPASAIDHDQDALVFHLSISPEGMTIDPASGFVQWVPNSAQLGVHGVQLIVVDGKGGTAIQEFQIEVRLENPNTPPAFLSIPITRIDSGEDYAYDATAFDPNNDVITYSLVASPNGMTIDSVSGLITYLQPVDGNHDVTVLADDGAGGTAEVVRSDRWRSCSQSRYAIRFFHTATRSGRRRALPICSAGRGHRWRHADLFPTTVAARHADSA